MNLFLWSDIFVSSSKQPFQYPDSPYFWENFKNMEKETAALIEKLAAKLGTTSEYLWKVLVKQAAISAWNDIISIGLCAIYCLVLYRIHKYLLKELPENERDRYGNRSLYEKHEAGAGVPMVTAAGIAAIWFLVSIASISSIITAFNNPEYWALKELLNQIQN